MFIFECLPLFLLSLFCPPPFSISLSLSLFCSCPFFFLLVFLFCFLLVLVFVSLFNFLSSLLWFHERNNIKIFNCNFFFINLFSFLWFPVLFFFQIPFSYLCYFLILSYVFVQHQCFQFQNKQLNKTDTFGEKGGCNKMFFFMSLCFAKCQKLSFFGAIFWQVLVDVQKTL